MDKSLVSVGLDVGTSTTQMIVSQIAVRNRASSFAVPDMAITDRQILYRSPVYLTPLLSDALVDGEGILRIVRQEYEKAGITPESVDTGAVIITGETSRKENAQTVLNSLSEFAGDFVVATAGPDLESILAAKGAGAVGFSEKTGQRVLHMDIGGGTSNLALIEDGKILKTGCLNVGGRLIKMDENHCVTYVSPVLRGLTDLKPGEFATREKLSQVAELLTQALEMAAGLREKTNLLDALLTKEVADSWDCAPGAVLSFSGGVADCIEKEHPFGAFGDLGPELGKAIGESSLCKGKFMLGTETIRATVIGAGCHSAQLSGSTVYFKNVQLPLKNLPVVCILEQEQLNPAAIRAKCRTADAETFVLAMPGFRAPTYEQVTELAQVLTESLEGSVFVCLHNDMAKALGQKLNLLLPENTPCLCLDRLKIQSESFLDVGEPVGPALPVVIKTLVLSQ